MSFEIEPHPTISVDCPLTCKTVLLTMVENKQFTKTHTRCQCLDICFACTDYHILSLHFPYLETIKDRPSWMVYRGSMDQSQTPNPSSPSTRESKINITDTDRCECGMTETVLHFLFSCPRCKNQRHKIGRSQRQR